MTTALCKECKQCGEVYPVVEKMPIDLTCRNCGGVDIRFNYKIRRKCLACGYVEEVEKEQECKAYHQKTPASPKNYHWEVERVEDSEETAKPSPRLKRARETEDK